jgi:hypothetical protein
LRILACNHLSGIGDGVGLGYRECLDATSVSLSPLADAS